MEASLNGCFVWFAEHATCNGWLWGGTYDDLTNCFC